MMEIKRIAETVCKHIPEGYEISLCMKRGAAYVVLVDGDGHYVELPDSAGKCLEDQINEAICVAKGFSAMPSILRKETRPTIEDEIMEEQRSIEQKMEIEREDARRRWNNPTDEMLKDGGLK